MSDELAEEDVVKKVVGGRCITKAKDTGLDMNR
jgi:hypothetical protein